MHDFSSSFIIFFSFFFFAFRLLILICRERLDLWDQEETKDLSEHQYVIMLCYAVLHCITLYHVSRIVI